MSFDVDITIVVAFLILNIIAGLYSGRNIKSIKEYALGNRNFSTATISATIIATWLGGSSFFMTVSETYNEGLYFIIPGLGDGISFFIIAYLIAPRVTEFLGKLSVADAMGSLYNKNVRMITAISAIMPAIGNIAIQFSVLATLLNCLLGISSIYTVLISGIIVITYSTFGGIKSVTFTDVIQFFTFGVVIPMTVFLVWKTMTGFDDVIYNLVQHDSFNYKKFFSYDNPDLLSTISLTLFFLIPGIDPIIFQRISMCNSGNQICKAFKTAGFFTISLDLILTTIIGILLVAHNPNINSDNLIPYMMDNYMYSGIRGIFIIGIMAMCMSTADSYINSSSVLLVHDICKSGGIKLTRKKELLLVRISSLLLGIFALIISLFSTRLFDIVTSTYGFYMPIVTVPLLLAIFGFRSTNKSVLIGMSAGFITVVIMNLFSDIDSLMFGMLANLIFFLGSHYLLKQKGGWVISTKAKGQKKGQFKILWQKIISFNFLTVCRKNTPKNEGLVILFGIFIMVSTFFSINTISKELQIQYGYLIDIFYPLTLCSATILIGYPLWASRWKETNVMAICWNIIIFFVLICFSFLIVLISNFSEVQLILFMVNILMISSLINWRWSLFYLVFGVCITLFVYERYLLPPQIQSGLYALEFKIIYLLLLVGSILIMFLKPKQQQQEATEEKAEYLKHEIIDLKRENECAKREIDNLAQGIEFLEKHFEQKKGKLEAKELYLRDQLKLMRTEVAKVKEMKDEFIRNVPHETNTPMTAILSLSEVLYSYYDSLDEGKIKESLKGIVNGGDRLKSYINNIADLSKLSSLSYDLEKKQLNLGQLIKDRTILYKKLFTDDTSKQEFTFDIDKDIMAYCDEYYITQAIDNLISNANKYGKGKSIKISLHKKEDGNIEFAIADKGIGIPKDELMKIFDKFTVSSKTRTPAEGRGVGLALCEKIIKLHKGKIWAESDGDNGSTFYFTIPAK